MELCGVVDGHEKYVEIKKIKTFRRLRDDFFMKKLTRKFFNQPTLKLARDILGKFLVHELPDGQKLEGMITEVEAYIGPRDKASHAYKWKRTMRNEIEYGRAGHIYIYLVYGMHWQFNIVTAGAGKPECILIRALRLPLTPTLSPRSGQGINMDADLNKITNGPGKLCKYLKLDKSFYGYDLCKKGTKLYVEDRGIKIKSSQITKSPRIGIDYAGQYWAKIPWRFKL